MSQTVVGLFHSREQAEEAVRELRNRDFDAGDISLITRGEESENSSEQTMDYEEQNLADGTLTDGVLGGMAGLLAGAGALLIPGIGPIIAAGPLAGALTGAVTGGIAGGLIDYGIPEDEGDRYEQEIRQGGVMVALEAEDENIAGEVEAILQENGAYEVKIHE
ncbi:MAG TPA: hypothetical protein GXZ53_02460 [Firmicutes bacterium]|nr:hypothetical protein [Bacillota bacterium]